MKIDSDDFELFGLPRRFELDRTALDARWRSLQSEVHPDRFAADGAAAQRLAMQWAVRINEAYRRLKDPIARAASLCELQGFAVDAESNTSMPTDFLMRQMEWREALGDATSVMQVEALNEDVKMHREAALSELRTTLDERRDGAAAVAQVRALMFTERFIADIDRRLEALGQ